MKALALLGLVFFSYVSLAQAQPEMKYSEYTGCKVYHRLNDQIVAGTWYGDCGSGFAEGYGIFLFNLKDKATRLNFMRYKNGRPVSSYAFGSDGIYGNRLIKTNADLSIAVLKDCGSSPDPECAALINFVFPDFSEMIATSQKVKGSYSGPKNYPGVTPDFTTSGGYTPAPAEFLKGSVGVKVACENWDEIKAALANPNIYNKNETRPCYKEKEFTKYNYFYLTTLDLSCPTGGNKKFDRWKYVIHADLISWLNAAKKACGVVFPAPDHVPTSGVGSASKGGDIVAGITPPPARFLEGIVGFKMVCDGQAIAEALASSPQVNLNDTRECYFEKEVAKHQYLFLTTLERSCPAGNKDTDSAKVATKRQLAIEIENAKKACSK